MNEFGFENLSAERAPVVVMVASSTGDGDPPDNCAKFYMALRRKSNANNLLQVRVWQISTGWGRPAAGGPVPTALWRAHWLSGAPAMKAARPTLGLLFPPPPLQGVQFTCMGLGDSNYTRFCHVPRTLRTRFADLGATEVRAPVAGQGEVLPLSPLLLLLQVAGLCIRVVADGWHRQHGAGGRGFSEAGSHLLCLLRSFMTVGRRTRWMAWSPLLRSGWMACGPRSRRWPSLVPRCVDMQCCPWCWDFAGQCMCVQWLPVLACEASVLCTLAATSRVGCSVMAPAFLPSCAGGRQGKHGHGGAQGRACAPALSRATGVGGG